MGAFLNCPNCGASDLDLHDYESMIVVTRESALFTLHCKACGKSVSSMKAIPADMRAAVQFAAIQVGAGMGRTR